MDNFLLVSRRGVIASRVLVIVVPIMFVSDVHAVTVTTEKSSDPLPKGCLAWKEFETQNTNNVVQFRGDISPGVWDLGKMLSTRDEIGKTSTELTSWSTQNPWSKQKAERGLNRHAYTHTMILSDVAKGNDILGLANESDAKCEGIYYNKLEHFRSKVNDLWSKFENSVDLSDPDLLSSQMLTIYASLALGAELLQILPFFSQPRAGPLGLGRRE